MAVEYTFKAERTAQWNRTVQWFQSGTPVNMTGYTAALIVAAINGPDLLTLDTDSGIVITPLVGTMQLTATTTDLEVLETGTYKCTLTVYDGVLAPTELLNSLFTVFDGVSVASGAIHFDLTAASTVTASFAFALTVSARDITDSVDTTYAGTVHFSSSDSDAVLPSNSTLTSGFGIFTVTLFTAGTQTVTATDSVTVVINGDVQIVVIAFNVPWEDLGTQTWDNWDLPWGS